MTKHQHEAELKASLTGQRVVCRTCGLILKSVGSWSDGKRKGDYEHQ